MECCLLGLQSGNYTITKMGTYTTYTPADMCTSPANDTGYIFPGIFNQVLVEGLTPSTKYYYTVGDEVNVLLHLHMQCLKSNITDIHSCLLS